MKVRVKKVVFIFILCSILSGSLFAQSFSQERKIDSLTVLTELDSLKNMFGTNKEIPARYELEILKALSRFPELEDITISFKVQKIKTTLNTRPTVASLFFRSKCKRKYIIRIDESTSPTKVTLKDANFNARIGVFGHEFNHIIDYSNKDFFGVLGRGFAYASKKSKEKFEKEIDQKTIARGLGWQLYDWSYYVLNKSNGTKKYKEFKRLIYLEPGEVKKAVSL